MCVRPIADHGEREAREHYIEYVARVEALIRELTPRLRYGDIHPQIAGEWFGSKS